MDGVLECLASTISTSLGNPWVVRMFATPALWNVRMFIWVPGSPMECAATTPADSWGTMRRFLYISLAFSMRSLWLPWTLSYLLFFSSWSCSDSMDLYTFSRREAISEITLSGRPLSTSSLMANRSSSSSLLSLTLLT